MISGEGQSQSIYILGCKLSSQPSPTCGYHITLMLRTEVNKVLEVAHGKKSIGSSLEAKVYLHAFDDNLAARLVDMCASESEADTLHRIFITSQEKTKSGLECQVQRVQNVIDAGIFRLKSALLTTTPRYVAYVTMLSASQFQPWQQFS
ncbi:unnamed protein product [Fraxinus pennsylvanica]|uniref:Uncharacterized protein n=1 Tax=Fraxinus pennsylvanica TaxID=56036 RepID=A0AAD2E5M7_9LAMI|nr:unnamed protein product [Fraxinus pennsylvanica]